MPAAFAGRPCAKGRANGSSLHGFPVPHGYNVTSATLGLMIPSSYPSAHLDMFWVHPVLTLTSGRALIEDAVADHDPWPDLPAVVQASLGGEPLASRHRQLGHPPRDRGGMSRS